MAATSKMLPAMWVIILILTLSTPLEGTRLNVPKVLLPYFSSVATNFTLEVSDGCFKWRSSRPEIAGVLPVDVKDNNDCSTRAVVSAVSKTPSRQTSIIIAEDPVSGQQFRCDVIVDVIYSIDVETTTRELYLEDSPMQFTLRALDDEGNVFSNLEGLSFDWSLISDTDVDQENIVDAHNILRILQYAESVYETPPHIESLENRGKQGHSILVEGIQTGSAKVAAKLADPIYKRVPETVVRLIVIANIMLNPPLVYLMRHSQVHYRVELLKQGKIHEIRMPSQQYFLELKDNALCRLDDRTSIVTALDMGYTDILLKDKNIKVKEAFRQPSGGIHIVNPGYLGFVVLPGRKWVLEAGRDYEILIEIYDKDSHKIHPSDNVRVIATFDESYLHVYSSSKNGTYHNVKALKRGFTTIHGHLKAVILIDGKEFLITPTIKNSQDVEIYDPIEVTPPILLFPWDTEKKASYQYKLEATGGSGNYTWSSSDTSMTNVNVRGRITTLTVGEATITAADMRNAAHTDSMKVYVVPPSELEFIPSRVEAEIGTTLELPLAMYGHIGTGNPRIEKHMFADCRKVPYSVSVKDAGGFVHEPVELPILAGSCTTVKIHVKKLGHTEVTAIYTHKNIKLSAKVTIAGYNPLKPIDPEEVAVVALGSSMEVVFQGGPQPWVLQPNQYKQTIIAEKNEIVKMTRVNRFGAIKTVHTFRVLCRELGEQYLTVTVGNGVTSKNRYPASASAKVRFACAQPVGLHLRPMVSHPTDLPPCPITQDSNEPMPIHSYQDLNLGVVVTDSNGRRFNNFSSLAFEWSLSDDSIAAFGNDGKIVTDITTTDTSKRIVDNYQLLIMLRKLGPLRITASISQYQRVYFTSQNIQHDLSIDPAISATLDLLSVEDPTISPDFISIFNHPSNKVRLEITGGSGYFLINHGNTELARVTYEQKKRDILVVPVLDGTFAVTAYDLCMKTAENARSEIHISGVNAIIMQVVDKVELHKEIKVRVSVLDKNGKPLKASYFPLMGLRPQPASNIINLRPDPAKNDDPFSVQYIVHGAALGRTMLHFTAKPQSGHTITSPDKSIQVFPPLRLNPRNITIIVGAVFQVTAQGGPQPQSTVEFSINNDDIAEISVSGLIDAQAVGQTRVVGRAVGYESETGRRIVYSQDEVNVHVVELEGIRIFAPLQRLQTGTQMPMYAMGTNEHETPFTFGSAIPPLTFTWSINNKEAVSLNSIYYKSGIRVPDESNFAVQLFAHQAGHVTVSLRVTPAPGSNYQLRENIRLHDEVQLQIFEKLRLTHPSSCDGSLLMTPNTETLVKTNRDGTARLTYHIETDDLVDSPVVAVSKTGQLVSASGSGHASLVVTAHEDFGVNQTIVILIKVKPVSYLMLNADTVIQTGGRSLSAIPVGSVLHFTVTYHDDVGEQFYTTNTALRHRPNRFDLIHVQTGPENGTLIARTTSVGQTVLKVWDQNNPGLADYVNIAVGYAISPSQSKVTLGDIICFSSPIVDGSGHVGFWSSDNPVVSMLGSSGIGVASRIGQSVVTYTAGEHTTNTEVTVAPVTQVLMKNDNLQHWTNVGGRTSSSSIPVILESGSAKSNLIGTNCSELVSGERYQVPVMLISCEASLSSTHPAVDVHDLVHVVADFDAATGQYVCKLTRVNMPDLIHLVSTLDTYVQIQAVVPPRENQPAISSGVVSLPFLPAFYVHSSELALSNLQPLGAIRVSASDRVFQDIKVTSSNSQLVQVQAPERDSQQEHLIHFPVRIVESAALWQTEKHELTVEVKCLATGQIQTVYLTIRLVGKEGQEKLAHDGREAGWGQLLHIIASNYQNWIFMLLCIFVIVFTLIITYHAVIGARTATASQQSGVFLQQGSPNQTAYQAPSPWNSPYSTGTSPSKIQMWTRGYDPDKSSPNLHQRSSPYNLSPYS